MAVLIKMKQNKTILIIVKCTNSSNLKGMLGFLRPKLVVNINPCTAMKKNCENVKKLPELGASLQRKKTQHFVKFYTAIIYKYIYLFFVTKRKWGKHTSITNIHNFAWTFWLSRLLVLVRKSLPG